MKKIKEFLKNESAISYGFLIIAAFLIGGSAIWIEFQPVFNQIFLFHNSNIADGLVTTRSNQAMQFQKNIITVVPIVMLIGIAAWGYIRALEKRNEP